MLVTKMLVTKLLVTNNPPIILNYSHFCFEQELITFYMISNTRVCILQNIPLPPPTYT